MEPNLLTNLKIKVTVMLVSIVGNIGSSSIYVLMNHLLNFRPIANNIIYTLYLSIRQFP